MLKRRREAGRIGGIRSQQVQRERRMELHRGEVVYPVSARWSIGVRDNWAREEGWFTFVSWRDALRRIRAVMAGLAVVVRKKEASRFH